MHIRFFVAIILFTLGAEAANAQVYDCDSVKLEIKYKDNFSVKDYEDLNIPIIYSCKPGNKGALVYTTLQNYGRSVFGNCYFELHKYDSVLQGYRDITDETDQGLHHAPGQFESREDVLKYDVEKSELRPGQQKILTFNLLNFAPAIFPGKYYMKVYMRVAETHGYDKEKKIITTSVHYLESESINFTISKEMYTPRGKLDRSE
jgi:hypothetical protein